MTGKCRDCKFWEEDRFIDMTESEGKCRRHAPAPALLIPVFKDIEGKQCADLPDNEWRWSEWPLTDANDWCGEFSKR